MKCKKCKRTIEIIQGGLMGAKLFQDERSIRLLEALLKEILNNNE